MTIISKLKNYYLKILSMNDVMLFDDYQDYLLLIASYEMIFAYKKNYLNYLNFKYVPVSRAIMST